MNLFCELTDLKTESDVEQKFILPMLTSVSPIGLGYTNADFKTKTELKEIVIGKGASKKSYFPDYVITIQGLPALIIEAKKPGEDIEEAMREARLYCTELNAEFAHNLNPCHKIIVSDGINVIAGDWDSKKVVALKYANIDSSDKLYIEFLSYVGKESVADYCKKIYKEIRGTREFRKPILMLGGKSVQNEELPQNRFGSTLSIEYRNLFNPEDEQDRINVVKNTYVTSKRRLKHVEPIDQIIRAAQPVSVTDSQKISTEQPTELVTKLKQVKNLKHALLLLIGNVGSGKSTFVDYLRITGLPPDLQKRTHWVTLDLNDVPLGRDDIYKWVKDQIILKLRNSTPQLNFDDLDVLKKVFYTEIHRFGIGPAQLLTRDSPEYNRKLAEEMMNWLNNQDIFMRALIRFLCTGQEKLLVVVLDNCDKRSKDDQLLMFAVAKWLQTQAECLVFLPLRDTTYDLYRKEPPLDTVVKDLIFRIDPPLIMEVLNRRVKYALSLINTNPNEQLSFPIGNGMIVSFRRSEQGTYLQSILTSLYGNDRFFQRLITGIAGRDIRLGIEIFLEFCKSGHIDETDIFKMRQSKGDYVLPSHIVTRVFFRGNRRYYQDTNSFIRNLFSSFPEDSFPDPFVRISILTWLKNRYRVTGPNNSLGYHKISELVSQLVLHGHEESRIKIEIIELIKARCILTESETEEVKDDDLISIAPAGHVHLELLGNLDYLSSTSEDVWYRDNTAAEKIARRLSYKGGSVHLSKDANIENAKDLIGYVEAYLETFLAKPELYIKSKGIEKLVDLDQSKNAIKYLQISSRHPTKEFLKAEYPDGSLVDVQVVAVKDYGVFVEFGIHAIGFIHGSYFENMGRSGNFIFSNIEKGTWLIAEIIRFRDDHGRFELKYVNQKM